VILGVQRKPVRHGERGGNELWKLTEVMGRQAAEEPQYTDSSSPCFMEPEHLRCLQLVIQNGTGFRRRRSNELAYRGRQAVEEPQYTNNYKQKFTMRHGIRFPEVSSPIHSKRNRIL